MEMLSALIMRIHSPLSLRAWDVLTITVALTFMALAAPFLVNGEHLAAFVSAVGGFVILWRCRYDQRSHLAAVWEFASLSDDPVETLAMHEYLYRARFRDVLALARWRAERERQGLPVIVDDPDAPPQMLALMAYLQGNPRER